MERTIPVQIAERGILIPNEALDGLDKNGAASAEGLAVDNPNHHP